MVAMRHVLVEILSRQAAAMAEIYIAKVDKVPRPETQSEAIQALGGLKISVRDIVFALRPLTKAKTMDKDLRADLRIMRSGIRKRRSYGSRANIDQKALVLASKGRMESF
jgi:hypothetical protein